MGVSVIEKERGREAEEASERDREMEKETQIRQFAPCVWKMLTFTLQGHSFAAYSVHTLLHF